MNWRAALSRHKRLAYGASGAAVMAGTVLIVLGPGGPSLAAHFAQDASIWRLGRLHVEGVTGSGLGELRVARATLRDANGVWAEAENLRVRWKPLNLLFGDVSIIDATLVRLRVVRQPTLAPAREGGGAVHFDTDAPALAIANLDLADGVAGPAARFMLAGAVRVEGNAVKGLSVDLRRLDNDLDALKISYSVNGKIELDAQADGAPGGTFANFLQAPDSAVRLRAHASGVGADGTGTLNSTIANTTFAAGDLSWSAQGWRGQGSLNLAASPKLDSYARRFGPDVSATGAGDPLQPTGAPFHLEVAAAQLAAQARGRLDTAVRPVGAVSLQLASTKLEALVPELGFDAGSVRFDGAAEFEDGRTRLSGRMAVEHAQRNGLDVNMEGPAEVFVRQAMISFTGQLAGGEIGAPDALREIFTRVNLSIDGAYDRVTSYWSFPKIQLTGPNAGLTGVGRIDNTGSTFNGAWDLPQISALIPGTRGAARGQWRLVDRPNAQPQLTFDGAARQFANLEPIAPLLGPTPRFNAAMHFTDDATIIDSAQAEGPRLRLGARGSIVGEDVKLALEASAKGPAKIYGQEFAGAADATGSLTGKLEAPTLSLQANLAELAVGGTSLHNVKISFDLAAGRSGRAGLEGLLYDRPAKVSARLAPVGADGLGFEDLHAEWVRLTAVGRAQVLDGVLSTDVELGGVLDGLTPQTNGAVSGALGFTNGPTGGSIALDADLRRARLSGGLTATQATITVHGPLDAMAGRFAINGWAGEEPITLRGEGTGALSDVAFSGAVTGRGTFAGANIATRVPVSWRVQDGVLDLAGALNIGSGAIAGTWRGDGEQVAIDAEFDKAPLDILTAGFDQPMAGTLSGKMHLAGAKSSLGGDADLTFAQARLARRSRDAVDAHLTATLGGGMLRGKLEAKSGKGLVADIEGQLPVVATAAPFQLVPVRGSVLEANWSIGGPVEGLWGLFGPFDQALAGNIEGAGAVRFANGQVTGDGKLSLAGGAFDDKLSGVRLRNIDAVVAFDQAGMTLDKFTATDGRSGQITGSGRLNGQNDGKLDLKLAGMRLVDRPDAVATGGGNIAVEWRGNGATLTGAIQLNSAEMRVVDAGTAPVPQIDVIEINRPGPPPRADSKPPAAIPVRLDLAITAPGRVFTRTRGLEAEWSLDMALRGDLSKPQVFGEARMLRGDFNLAGRPFAMQHGVITFAGAPEEAQLDVLATAETAELTGKITLTGRALDPTIELSSDPPLPEDEVLPQLLFGHSSRELSAFEAAQLAASLATLAGQSAFDIAGAARAAVALDRLEFRQDVGGVLIAGGKYLTRDVYLEVSRDALGQAGTSLEWQLRPRFFVISSFLPGGDQKIAVRWRHDY